LIPRAEMVSSVVTRLAAGTATGSPKSRWSACYALGAMMKAAEQFGAVPAAWKGPVMSSLRTCLLESPNHKVRIAAAQAIMVWRSRAAYGSSFASVFECFLLALRHIDDDNDFRNYKYKETLRAQVCGDSWLLHVVWVACMLSGVWVVRVCGACGACGACGPCGVGLHCVSLLGVSQ